MEKKTFDVIILIGRPAAGKSEVIDYLKKIPLPERIKRFHIGEFQEIDDFPILWERFEDDDMMEEMGQPRLLTDKEFTYEGKTMPGHVFKDKWFWNFLIKKLNLQYFKMLRNDPAFHEHKTLFIEFARGKRARRLPRGLLPPLAAGAGPRRRPLHQGRLARVAAQEPPALQPRPPRLHPAARPGGQEDRDALQGVGLGRVRRRPEVPAARASRKVPYAVFENMPEKTDKPDVLGAHLEEVLGRLWQAWREVKK